MLDIDEMHERQKLEWRGRVLAVITELGGQQRQPLVVPEDDPANNELVLRLASEILFLRDQLQHIATAVEWAQPGSRLVSKR
jgi:hypothetical protein